MGVRGDERAQAIQIGAVLLFAFLVLAFAGYQAVLVPQQNAEVEAAHAQEVAADVVDLRSAIVDAWSVGDTRSATVRLGTTYPARIAAVNPPPPGGTLRTGTAGEITVRGPGDAPVSTCGSTSVSTRALTYEPGYNEFANAPAVVYENSVVYRRYDDEVLFDSGQRVVQNETVNVVAVASPYRRSGTGARSVDAVPGTRTVTHVEIGPAQDLHVTFPSGLAASTWNARLLDDQPHATASSAGDDVTVTLEGPDSGDGDPPLVNYTVVCRQVGLDRAP